LAIPSRMNFGIAERQSQARIIARVIRNWGRGNE